MEKMKSKVLSIYWCFILLASSVTEVLCRKVGVSGESSNDSQVHWCPTGSHPHHIHKLKAICHMLLKFRAMFGKRGCFGGLPPRPWRNRQVNPSSACQCHHARLALIPVTNVIIIHVLTPLLPIKRHSLSG